MISKCRICGGELEVRIDLGDFYLSDFLEDSEEAVKDTLVLATCKDCGLAQLRDTPDLDFMYKDHYWYRSSLNTSMLKDLKDVVENIEKRIELNDGNVVCDLGCNDAAMLGMYSNQNLVKVGFDPAPNMNKSASENCDVFINDYFSADEYFKLVDKQASVVTTIAVFYDLPNPGKFVDDIKSILDDNGIWVMQLTDLYSMLKTNGIDSINSEHLEYYRLLDIDRLLFRHGFQIFDVEYNKVNGGSLRCYICKKGSRKVKDSFVEALTKEGQDFGSGEVSIEKLIKNTNTFKSKILEFLSQYTLDEVYALAASTKANTMLQFMGLNNTKIKAIGEVNTDKFGLTTAGTGIEIVPESIVLSANPKVIIILAWHFENTFLTLLKDYIKNGCIVLFMLPEPRIYNKNGVFYL
jgi:NDP-4-keto-2,6-dideoxyhexose 3-C-methyltransferase